MEHPRIGQLVKVWPAAGVRVQDGADRMGKFLSPEGREVVWDSYWERRFLDGHIHLRNPTPGESR
jgi:hypothetical protein